MKTKTKKSATEDTAKRVTFFLQNKNTPFRQKLKKDFNYFLKEIMK